MNSRITFYLPLSLLLSATIYTMDTEAEKKDTKKLDLSAQTNTIVITPEQSAVIQAAPTRSSSDREPMITSSIQVQSKNLGVITGFKDYWYGASSTVAHEIANDKFDKSIPANMRRLSKAIEELTKVQSQENLKTLSEILENCRTKEIVINDVPVLQLARSYASEMRTKEETQLTDEAKVALQNADKERSALILDLKKKFLEVIEKTHAIDKKLIDELDTVHKKHGDPIALCTQAKRLTRMVNEHIPADGYDSDTDSKYDRPFNARKLGLEQPTMLNHKVNQRVAENLDTIKNIVELVDKQKIKANGE